MTLFASKLGSKLLWNGFPVLLALAAGYTGSALHTWLTQTRSPSALRANRFDLIDESGKTVAFWAANPVSSKTGGAMLVFTDSRGVPRFEAGMESANDTPFLRLYGDDRAERLRMILGYNDDPVLLLRDGRKTRVVLGATHSDAPTPLEDQWGLSFYARKEGASASIGFYRWWDESYRANVELNNGSGRKWEAVVGGDLKPVPLAKRRD